VAQLSRRLLGLAAVGLAVAATAAPAFADGPADVTVRVEGDADTLVPRTALTTTTALVVKDGTNACAGTSAAGALEQATAGDWSGPWFAGLGYSVAVIRGEEHAFGGDPEFWGLFLNDVLAAGGLCETQLQTGDSVLFAPIPEDGSPANVLVLSGVPATVAPGAPFTVSVARVTSDFNGAVTRQPVAGASVGGATTGADGTARIALSARGPAGLRATHGGDVRSATESVCVTDGGDGACGTASPGPVAGAPCATTGDDGNCGTGDRRAPRGKIDSIRNGQRFARGRGPRLLSGSVTADPSGIADVRLRLTRNDHGRCATFDARSERLVKRRRCGAKHGRWFSAGDRERWSYLLPARLGRGRYVLDLRARDRAGNVDGQLQRTRTRVVFFVS
jgi:hypothetical protein